MAVQLDDGGARALRRHDRGAGHRRAHRGGRGGGDGHARRAASPGCRSPTARRPRRRHGRVRRRHPPAGRAGARRRARRGRAGRRRRRRRAARRPTRTCSAIGEVACHRGGRAYGLVAPGYRHGRRRRRPPGRRRPRRSTGADLSTKLKLLGVDVASVGDASPGRRAPTRSCTPTPSPACTRSWCCRRDGTRILGGILVGDAGAYGSVLAVRARRRGRPRRPRAPHPAGGGTASRWGSRPATCPTPPPSARATTSPSGAICAAIADGGLDDVGGDQGLHQGRHRLRRLRARAHRAARRRAAAGRQGRSCKRLCEHFAMTRPELFEVVRVTGIRTFAELVDRPRHGRGLRDLQAGRGVDARLAAHPATSSTASRRSLQDTNDHFLANLQRDGTYSVVPRVPGGEITPDQLIAIGEVARDFDLYTKITGGQRIDLFGARVDQLPAIWAPAGRRRLRVGPRLRQGAAHREVVRRRRRGAATACRTRCSWPSTSSCATGACARRTRSSWPCRAAPASAPRPRARTSASSPPSGAGTSTSAATAACARSTPSCSPRTSTTTTLVRYHRPLPHVLRPHRRPARAHRDLAQQAARAASTTSRPVVLDDALGIGAELEADMARHVDTYECEWAATLDDPERAGPVPSVRQHRRARPAARLRAGAGPAPAVDVRQPLRRGRTIRRPRVPA